MEQKFLYNQWVVNAAQAKQLILQGATVLDGRNFAAWLLGHVPGAVHVTWQQFSQQEVPYKGKLIESSNILEQKLRDVGVFNAKPVIVVGNPAHNFGEEGRIVWMLRTLGHSQTVFVDGGYAALIQTGVPIARGISQLQARGDFVVKRTALWEAQLDEVNIAAKASAQNFTVIDTRELREYAGATPYGEQRGGHIPSAVHYYFKDLMDTNGYLLRREQIIARLNQLGIQQDTAIVAYCTGGIRSAFFVAVLINLGFINAKNYAGSIWEWSAAPALLYPLI
ncbi:MAG: hypothetical protein JO235_22935 [Chroococcidiopsidaceae cyanobacterium CP_BM_RX_35]|nr:hypothetical protein [Chroococcidiopsidaceae cyanobacterium CP_BM_RX_35]